MPSLPVPFANLLACLGVVVPPNPAQARLVRDQSVTSGAPLPTLDRMDTTHPFDSAEDQERRRRQREIVLTLSKTDVEGIGASLSKPTRRHTGHAERWLRRRADTLLDQHAALFDRIRAENEAIEVASLLDDASRPETAEIRRGRLETRGHVEPRYQQMWSQEEGGVMVHLVELMTWADDIAGDGYSTRPNESPTPFVA